MTPDPNWLLSTTAQSAAALVAIVAGFLLSRVLAMVTERNGLTFRESQLRNEAEHAHEAYARLQSRIDDRNRADFLDDATSVLMENPEATLNDVYDDWGLDRQELAKLFEAKRAVVRRAYSDLTAHVPPRSSLGFGTQVPFEDVKPHLALTETEDIDIYSRVWQKLCPSLTSLSLVGRSYIAPDDDPYLGWVRDGREALAERDRAHAELEIVRTELAKVSSPRGIGRLASSLAFFLSTGVLVPVAVLAQQPTRLSASQAWLIFGGFATGLVVVAIAVAVSVREAVSTHSPYTRSQRRKTDNAQNSQ